MKPISTTLYTRAFHRWYTATYGAGRARAMPRYLILALEMMRLRSPMRHIRLLVHDPRYELGPWLLAYARWINEHIRYRCDPLIIRPGPRHLRIDTSRWPGLRFSSLRRPDSVRGTTTAFGMIVCADSCAPRESGHDLFHRARIALTGMVSLRHSILIYHGNAHTPRHHFRQAWHTALAQGPDSPFLAYDAEHPDAILDQLERYRRPYRPPSTPPAPAVQAPSQPRAVHLHRPPRLRLRNLTVHTGPTARRA